MIEYHSANCSEYAHPDSAAVIKTIKFINGLPNAPPPDAEVITKSPEEEALEAIENEDYELASKIRDEIKRRD